MRHRRSALQYGEDISQVSGQSGWSPLVERLHKAAESGRSVVLTGPMGIGKTHTLRALHELLAKAGRQVPIIRGSAPGRHIPLGPFAGVPGLKLDGAPTSKAVIDGLMRGGAVSAVLVDDSELLDDSSLFVITQLIAAGRFPIILTARDLNSAPDALKQLYDSGDLIEIVVEPLSDDQARKLIFSALDGKVTPRAKAQLIAAAGGNPLHLREIIRGSIDHGRLIETPHGWELEGTPGATKRLTQILGARFEKLPGSALDMATVIALAHEYPFSAIDPEDRDLLFRAGVIDLVEEGWVVLANLLDAEYLEGRCPPGLLRALAQRAARALREADPDEHPAVRRQAALLALDYNFDMDIDSTLALAEHALATADVRLAQRAADAVGEIDPGNVAALRVAGLVASFLGDLHVADERFAQARERAETDTELATVALAHAQHLGTKRHDAKAALDVLTEAIDSVSDSLSRGYLWGAQMRWAAISGSGIERRSDADSEDGHDVAMNLIVSGLSGVTWGRLGDAKANLAKARKIPADILASIPGGDSLVDITEALTHFYGGDLAAARKMLLARLEAARIDKPESLGLWEFRLGQVELFTRNADEAYRLGCEAVRHLSWRDGAGLLPAAHALVAASATGTGRSIEARQAVSAIPKPAAGDPRVVMFGAWRKAWEAWTERKTEQAAGFLLDGVHWLNNARHVYLAAILAHDLVRQGRRTAEAAELLRTIHDRTGADLVGFYLRHADAVLAGDLDAVEQCAVDALELGLNASAADTRLWLAGAEPTHTKSLRHDVAAERIQAQSPSMALWNAESKGLPLLTKREHVVIRYAAERYTAKEIAALNGVSVNTVTNQLASAFRKLGISSREELRELFGTH